MYRMKTRHPTHWHLVATTALACSLACALSSTAQAAPFTTRLTAQDVYYAYTGDANGNGLSLLGGDSNGANAETYSGNTTAGAYLYVVAWTIAHDEVQAFQGSVTVGSNTVYTDASHWQAITRPDPYEGFAYGPTFPALPNALLMADIAGGGWQAPLAVAAANTFGDVHGGGQASWIWSTSFAPPPGAPTYTIFRTQLEEGQTQNEVPEPGSLGLALAALAALGGLGGLRQRRAGAAASARR
jgi:hypothetical protein